ncbi:NAD(P)/FAD-dependent oxidoreductase [Pararhizobium arenae]|uniref:NAD(P)/FAD-dependent oxidoreductase n=1 Tax=Pararhizobium arenae TaxID=1856850 RepID=UPI00094B1EB6|nr:FAD-dependent oxidoreductase [Pararhizobium arenae]
MLTSIEMPDGPEQADLRAGRAPWGYQGRRPSSEPLAQSIKTDVLVVGGGITGSMVAQHLSSRNLQVVIADRERPGLGSTAASTAMLLWEIDKSLAQLSELYGFERAASIYRRSLAAMGGLTKLVTELRLDCRFVQRPTLYIAGPEASERSLLEEHRLRARAGLPGDYLDQSSLRTNFGINRAESLHSPGAAEADPLLMSWGLLGHAIASGAKMIDAEITGYDHGAQRVHAVTDNGFEIEARHVVLATGYSMPDFVDNDLHRTVSSYAIATGPQPQKGLWPNGALIWEASEDYLYARTTSDGRIVVGGEDDDIMDPDRRSGKIPSKARILEEKLAQLWPAAQPAAEYSWSGAFGETVDGLPLIGPVPAMPRILAAYGYGGNGITFSFMASRMLAAMIAGDRQDGFELFALDRTPFSA